MAAFFTEIKQRFKLGSLLTRLVMINIGIFVVMQLLMGILRLFELPLDMVMMQFELPASLPHLAIRPWTLFTYMFIHAGVMHLLFNMLALYGFGQLFLYFFNEKQLGGLYLMGGLSGAVFYLLAYNLFPYFSSMVVGSMLVGASASVIAIIVATAVYSPEFKVRMMFLGEMPLKYIALATIVLDLLSFFSANAGGHIAHLGGAFMGFVFGYQLRKGHDITRLINRLIDGVANLFKPRPRKAKMKVNTPRTESDGDYNARKAREMAQIDAILDKVKKSGYGALSTEEKKQLFEASNK